jgi:hypothetical protein
VLVKLEVTRQDVPGEAGGPSGGLVERLAVLGDERLECHRGTAAELLDEVVGALEDPVLVVDDDLTEVLE